MQDINQDDIGRIVAIRYKGKMYDHYGILDGKGGVIHVHKKKGMITLDPMERVLKHATKIVYYDDEIDVRLRQYQHASVLIGSAHQYKFFTDNCESWVQNIRTGKAFSKQVDSFVNTTSIALLLASAIIGIENIMSNE